MTRKEIEEKALSLLLKQKLSGRYALSFLDLPHFVTGGSVLIGSLSDYEIRTGSRLESRPEGLTVILGGRILVLYDDRVNNRLRINWTIAHELGHIYLNHKSDGRREQLEADRFAASLLMPEAVIRFLDCSLDRRLSELEMQSYFSASRLACKKRRLELDRLPYQQTELGNELVSRLFSECSPLPCEELDNFVASVI